MAARVLITGILLSGCLAPAWLPAADEHPDDGPPLRIRNGTLVVSPQTPVDSRKLIVHFHGAGETVRLAHARTAADDVLAVVNFPGLSSAYSQPFADDPMLFEMILSHAWQQTHPEADSPAHDWECVTLSSFSAGYGAIREILKSPEHFDRVDAIITADSIYAGLVADVPERRVDPAQMRDFLRFAGLACDGSKCFVISHSSQSTPYASTTETADYLLRELMISRRPDDSLSTPTLRQSSRAERGKFVVLGFQGEAGKDHLQHLREIDVLWKLRNPGDATR